MMNWTIVSVLLAFCFGIFGVANYLGSNIDKQIDAKLNDPKFIKEVADKIRLPFIIFDENERVTVNSGAEEYIDSVHVTKKTITDRTIRPYKIIDTITVKCKHFMLISPVLQCITGRMQFYDAKRVNEKGWIFTVYHGGDLITTEPLSQGEPPPELFKLDIIPDN